MLPFQFILVISLCIGISISYANDINKESQSEESSEKTNTESKSSLDNEINESATASADTSNITYKVKVQFDSITVYEDHEGPLSGDAEYDLTAYVQGVKVEL